MPTGARDTPFVFINFVRRYSMKKSEMSSAHSSMAALLKQENIGQAYISTGADFLSNYFANIL